MFFTPPYLRHLSRFTRFTHFPCFYPRRILACTVAVHNIPSPCFRCFKFSFTSRSNRSSHQRQIERVGVTGTAVGQLIVQTCLCVACTRLARRPFDYERSIREAVLPRRARRRPATAGKLHVDVHPATIIPLSPCKLRNRVSFGSAPSYRPVRVCHICLPASYYSGHLLNRVMQNRATSATPC